MSFWNWSPWSKKTTPYVCVTVRLASEVKRIRSEYKALGWNSRMVSVRQDKAAGCWSICVELKSPEVDFDTADAIMRSGGFADTGPAFEGFNSNSKHCFVWIKVAQELRNREINASRREAGLCVTHGEDPNVCGCGSRREAILAQRSRKS